MVLSLRGVLDIPGASLPVDCSLDWSELELNFQTPALEPIRVSGEVSNAAGIVKLDAVMETNLHLRCDRCLTSFERHYRLPVTAVLGETREDDENEDIFLLQDSSLDLSELLQSVFILEWDMAVLCSEDCKGLCPGCGENLNTDDCKCRKEVDPRLKALQDYKF